jgi:hypothetical protein
LIGTNDGKPGLFYVRLFDATVINENQIGLVDALDGAQLNPRDYVAEPVEATTTFRTATTFINRGGQRGPQKDILLPGILLHQSLLFKVIPETAKEVKPGEVAVIVSNTGKDLPTKCAGRWPRRCARAWSAKSKPRSNSRQRVSIRSTTAARPKKSRKTC